MPFGNCILFIYFNVNIKRGMIYVPGNRFQGLNQRDKGNLSVKYAIPYGAYR